MTQHNETFEPIDRSMPRVRITRSWPNAMMQTPAGLLEDVADVPERHEDVALGGRPEEQHHQRQDE